MRYQLLKLIIMFSISYVLYKFNKPYERGFHCDDTSIFKPFHPIIIPMYYLLLFSALIPTVVMCLVMSGPQLYLKLYKFYFGLILSFILVLSCKNLFGRLRPNSIAGICHATHYCNISSAYIPEFECVNALPKLVKEARLSFYSGHSSVGAYSAVYLMIFIYFHVRVNAKIKLLLLSLVLIVGLVPGYTQGITNWHHVSDIAVGYSVGALTALFVVKYNYLSNNYFD